MKLPVWATTVTPLSKTIALMVFITFPIMMFYLGYSIGINSLSTPPTKPADVALSVTPTTIIPTQTIPNPTPNPYITVMHCQTNADCGGIPHICRENGTCGYVDEFIEPNCSNDSDCPPRNGCILYQCFSGSCQSINMCTNQ